MNNIMKLADAYAESLAELENENWVNGTVGGGSVEFVDTARAELEAAVEQQAAEIERLNDRWAEWKDSLNSVMEQRNALQAKLDELTKQEPVGFISPHDLQMLSEGYPRTVVMLAGAKHTIPLYTAPKVIPLTDEDLDTCRQWFNSVQDTNGGYLVPADYVLAEKLYRLIGMRVPSSITNVTSAHAIGGQQP